jgi:hypothetical protein
MVCAGGQTCFFEEFFFCLSATCGSVTAFTKNAARQEVGNAVARYVYCEAFGGARIRRRSGNVQFHKEITFTFLRSATPLPSPTSYIFGDIDAILWTLI